jgi:hypothetical protein
MFRRNKNKGTKTKLLQDDMVALTGPDALSSSSGGGERISVSTKSKKDNGGRFRRKNKIDKLFTAAQARPTVSISGRDQAPTAKTSNVQMNAAGHPQLHPQTQPQPAPESAPQETKNRPPSKTDEKYLQPQQRHQRKQKKRAPPSNTLETRDETSSHIQRHSSHQSNSLPSLDAASKGSSSNVVSREQSNIQMVAAAATAALSRPAASIRNQQRVSTSVSNERGESNRNAVPMTRTGWSMQSNASSAMNSERYIESLESLPLKEPSVQSGKVSLRMTCVFSQLLHCDYCVPSPHLTQHVLFDTVIPHAQR